MELIDTHAHLDEQAFAQDLPQTLDRAREAGLVRILTIGITLESSRAAIALAERFDMVYAAVGIHPNYASQAHQDDWPAICELARHPKVVAVGETGLDRYWDHTLIDTQVDYFRRHLALTRETGKPFIIHCREAENEVLDILRDEMGGGPIPGLMHSFCGSKQAAEETLGWGMSLSFSGMLTYKKNEELRALAAGVPDDRILVETDCPYLAPLPHRGKRNEPSFVKQTARVLAEARGRTIDEVAQLTTANARRLFGF
ncbi:TatD family hydrolase [Planctomyces sp. SH-PL14]|uniref:TatD family hydrolase n=1 Tax=Planctomyces sp. SH-PL14 TaxID=1632864 RepID=UPI00078C2F46|nr:TatD family hydrolase [Planctomyces sp. SH-PL14]AMV22561.1 putative deoxyribonuclease YcfH [Planctomyces sp. SH-PL14]